MSSKPRVRSAPIKRLKCTKSRVLYILVGTACLLGLMAGFILESLLGDNLIFHSGFPSALLAATAQVATANVDKLTERAPTQPLFSMGNYTGYARAYESWPKDRPFPCFPTDGTSTKWSKSYLMIRTPVADGSGLMFQRPLKSGSTTVAATVMRIAHRKAHLVQGQVNYTIACKHRAIHGAAFTNLHFHKRVKEKSFLFSVIRDPTKRAISEFFHFSVSVHLKDPTDRIFQQELSAPFFNNYYIRDLALRQTPTPAKYEQTVKEIIDGYNFIAITERLDESLVVFKMLLHLELEDILYVRERSQGSFSNGPPLTRPCLYVWPSFVTKGMKAFFASKKWENQVKGDYMLYEAAKKSLDLTIERLGRVRFEGELARFKAALKTAQEVCGPRAVSMCKEDGSPAKNTTCYIWGEGCSHACLDEIKVPPE